MSKHIKTYEDLLLEKERLTQLLKAQKELVHRDIAEIKQELAPVRSAISFVGKFATKDKSSLLLNTVSDQVVDLLVKKVLLARSGWLTRLAIPFLVKNFSTHFLAENKNAIWAKIVSFFSGAKGDAAEEKEGAENPGAKEKEE